MGDLRCGDRVGRQDPVFCDRGCFSRGAVHGDASYVFRVMVFRHHRWLKKFDMTVPIDSKKKRETQSTPPHRSGLTVRLKKKYKKNK